MKLHAAVKLLEGGKIPLPRITGKKSKKIKVDPYRYICKFFLECRFSRKKLADNMMVEIDESCANCKMNRR